LLDLCLKEGKRSRRRDTSGWQTKKTEGTSLHAQSKVRSGIAGGIEYRGMNVDKCFACDGVWFDTGEIDLLSKLD
jgi:hypothetical protein